MGRRYLQYSEQRKDHYVKYIKKTKGTHFDTLIPEALCEVVTPKGRSQHEKEVRGGGAFQQRRGYFQRLGDGGRRPMWLESRGEKGRRGAGRGRQRPGQAGRCKGKPVNFHRTHLAAMRSTNEALLCLWGGHGVSGISQRI